jgi:hypothetical protein
LLRDKVKGREAIIGFHDLITPAGEPPSKDRTIVLNVVNYKEPRLSRSSSRHRLAFESSDGSSSGVPAVP